MKINKFAVIRAKYSSRLYGGGYCKPGELIVMFPRNIFIGIDKTTDKKEFCNSYVRLHDLSKYPEFSEVRTCIEKQYGINTDTFGKMRTVWRH